MLKDAKLQVSFITSSMLSGLKRNKEAQRMLGIREALKNRKKRHERTAKEIDNLDILLFCSKFRTTCLLEI